MATYVGQRASKVVCGVNARVSISEGEIDVTIGGNHVFCLGLTVADELLTFVRECIVEYQMAKKAWGG